MSVASDFWTGAQEPPGSSARRLAQSFRRASAASPGSSYPKRSTSKTEVPESRRTSLAVLPFRITRSPKSASKPSERVEQYLDGSMPRLDRVFFYLPPEIQVEIASYLELSDLFTLRLSAKAFTTFLDTNASAISRIVLSKTSLTDDAIYLQCLYPPPVPCLNLNYLLQMLRRQIVLEQVVNFVVEFIQTKIYLIKSGPRVKQFEPYRDKLRDRLQKPAFVVCHYLESLQRLLLQWDQDHHDRLGTTPSRTSRSYLAALSDLADKYPKGDVVSAFQFYKLLILHLRQSLRAPTYAGTLERTLRGWAREPAKEEEIAQLLVFGGLEQVLNIIKSTSYTTRLDRVMQFVEKVSNAAKQNANRKDSQQSRSKLTAMEESAPPFDTLTSTSLELLPPLDDILVSDFQDRIVLERLIDHERELASPFGYIQAIMADAGGPGSRVGAVALRGVRVAGFGPVPEST